ncbi:olfactomedin-4 [Oryzias latipes]|uniref:Si:ch211-194m7.5 n=1 Tax=Oryzias latipes TaxID=8090 RepID=A0A3B3I5S3_ORYLA|nr:olfactomedin-4 [Oryzias latipes]
MKLSVLLPLCALLTLSQQAPSKCECELVNINQAFPHDKLSRIQDDASSCNTRITPQSSFVMESALLGLQRRLPQLMKDVVELEEHHDEDLYSVLSLHVLENELIEIQLLMDKLNGSIRGNRELAVNTTDLLQELKEGLADLEHFDTMQVVKRQQVNQRLKKDLDQCRNGLQPTVMPTQPKEGTCPLGQLVNITKQVASTSGEYPGSYKYGGWGRDPKPETGKESWYWVVMLTSSNIYSNYIRFYSTLSSLIVGKSTPGNIQIHSSNPTTNTIQGPNVVLYGGALYYNCYNQLSVCRFNLTSKAITVTNLPKGTRFNSKGNFCRLDECYPYTDLDLATDESGVWVTYTTSQDFGNLVLSKVEEGESPKLNQTWHTSIYKQAVTNTFMACGVLYATRYVNTSTEEIFYSFDTATGKENFNVGIFLSKVSPNILFLNYSPVDQMLHAYCDSQMVSYRLLFENNDSLNA